jgi:hypothetical protein
MLGTPGTEERSLSPAARADSKHVLADVARSYSIPRGYTAKIGPQSLEAFMPDIYDKRNNCLRKTRFTYNGYRLTAYRRGLRFSLVLKGTSINCVAAKQASGSSRKTTPSPACRGGLGWGASAASHGSRTSPRYVFLAEFSRTLKPKQPHPSPPLLPQGRGRIMASVKLYGLVRPSDEQPAIYRNALKHGLETWGVASP